MKRTKKNILIIEFIISFFSHVGIISLLSWVIFNHTIYANVFLKILFVSYLFASILYLIKIFLINYKNEELK